MHFRPRVPPSERFGNSKKDDDRPSDVDREQFDRFDKDKTGQLELEEVRAMLEEVGSECDEAYLSTMMRKYDLDGNGTVGFEEFQEMWKFLTLKIVVPTNEKELFECCADKTSLWSRAFDCKIFPQDKYNPFHVDRSGASGAVMPLETVSAGEPPKADAKGQMKFANPLADEDDGDDDGEAGSATDTPPVEKE